MTTERVDDPAGPKIQSNGVHREVASGKLVTEKAPLAIPYVEDLPCPYQAVGRPGPVAKSYQARRKLG